MESEKKRRKYSTSSNDSDTTDSQVTTWSRLSKSTGTKSTWVRQEQKKPSEVFRTDFITAMKLPDSAGLSQEGFYVLSDPWRQDWEKGVQVPASLEAIPEPVVRLLPEVGGIPFYWTGSQLRRGCEGGPGAEVPPPSEPLSRYDLDELDVSWLELVNGEFRDMASGLDASCPEFSGYDLMAADKEYNCLFKSPSGLSLFSLPLQDPEIFSPKRTLVFCSPAHRSTQHTTQYETNTVQISRQG